MIAPLFDTVFQLGSVRCKRSYAAVRDRRDLYGDHDGVHQRCHPHINLLGLTFRPRLAAAGHHGLRIAVVYAHSKTFDAIEKANDNDCKMIVV